MPEYGAVKGWNNRIRIGVSSAANESIWKAGRDPLLNSFSLETSTDIEKIWVVGSREPVSIIEGVTDITGSLERNLYSKNATYNEFIYVNDSTHYDLLKATGLSGEESLSCKILYNSLSNDPNKKYNRILDNVKFHDYRITHSARDIVVESVDFDASRLYILAKRMITIIGTNTTLNDYQVKIELNTSNFDFTHTSKDGSGVFFIDRNENEIPHWVETWNSSNAVVWCKVPMIPANSSTHIWMVYGDVDVQTKSNGDATFEFFDDFESSFGPKDYFAANGMSQPLYGIINYPPVVYYNGKTYIVWQADRGLDPYIIYYDHQTKTWSDKYKVGINPLNNDDHGAPAIAIDGNGHIHVFWGCHAGFGAMKHAKSANPEDISSWTTLADVPLTDPTYPNLVVDGNDMYLFYRSGSASSGSHLWYVKSTDNGDSWSAEYDIVDAPSNGCVYMGTLELKNGKIHFAWTYNYGGGIGEGRRNIYHAYLDTSNGHLYSVDGTDLGTNITESEADTYCKVVDTGSDVSNQPTMHLDASGNPHIIYIKGAESNFTFYYTRWDGSTWTTPVSITTTDNVFNYVDFILYSLTNIEAYLTTSGQNGRGGDIEKWNWDGTSWSKDHTVLSETVSGVPLDMPIVPVNFNSDLKVIFCQVKPDDYSDSSLKLYAYDGSNFVQNILCLLDLDKWEGYTNDFEVAEGRLRCKKNTLTSIVARNSSMADCIIEYEVYSFGCGAGIYAYGTAIFRKQANGDFFWAGYYDRDDVPLAQVYAYINGSHTTLAENTNIGLCPDYTNSHWRIEIHGDTVEVFADTDPKGQGILKVSYTGLNSYISTAGQFGIHAKALGVPYVEFDNFRVRKYASPEPTVII